MILSRTLNSGVNNTVKEFAERETEIEHWQRDFRVQTRVFVTAELLLLSLIHYGNGGVLFQKDVQTTETSG
jgi:hypothetical protein